MTTKRIPEVVRVHRLVSPAAPPEPVRPSDLPCLKAGPRFERSVRQFLADKRRRVERLSGGEP